VASALVDGDDRCVLTDGGARNLLGGLIDAIDRGDESGQAAVLHVLDELPASDLLLMDSLARVYSPTGTFLTGVALAARLQAREGLLALLGASLHGDGYLRQRAVSGLRSHRGPLVAAFLALRCLDHVPQVRDTARTALAAGSLDDADRALAVLLGGAAKAHGGAALAELVTRVRSQFGNEGLRHLRTSRDDGVRRWAYRRCLDHGLLDRAELRVSLYRERDQLIRALCAQALAVHADPDDVRVLLGGQLTAGRLSVLTHVPDDQLTDGQLRALLVDRAATVRRSALWRARRRGIETDEYYRLLLPTEQSPARVAACLAGLADTGNAEDVPVLVDFLELPSARVRAAAVTAIAQLALVEQLPELLGPRMLDPAGKVATAAARAMTRCASADTSGWTEMAWGSRSPGSRKAAWLLAHSRGGWYRVEADARAAADQDDTLARLGRGGMVSWLAGGAATTYGQPDPDQSARIAAALPAAGLAQDKMDQLAFHVGLPKSEHTQRPPAASAQQPRHRGRKFGLLTRLRRNHR
jgi:hypothetical protein